MRRLTSRAPPPAGESTPPARNPRKRRSSPDKFLRRRSGRALGPSHPACARRNHRNTLAEAWPVLRPAGVV